MKARYLAVAAALLLVVIGHYLLAPTFGAQLGDRSLQLANSDVSAATNYKVSFSFSTAGTLGSVLVQFCSNDPFPGTACTPPGGFDDSAAVLTSQSGQTGFSIASPTNPNQIVLTRAPSAATTGPASYEFSGITNPSTPGGYFVRLQTFATNDASGPASDYGGLAFSINNNTTITAEVPPFLIFCTGVTIGGLNCANANGDYIDFGELSTHATGKGSSQMLVATNAADGYSITADGTALSSGNNTIPALAANDVSRPGVAQFGFNLRSNSTPADGSDVVGPGVAQPVANYNQPDSYHFVPGDTLVTNPVPDDVRKFTISYIANVPLTQAPGIYVSTVTYIALANF